MEIEALRGVLGSNRSGWIGGHRRRRRHLRQWAAVRAPELEGPVSPALELIALLVHRAVMSPAE